MKNKKLIVGLLACLLAVCVPFLARQPNKAKAVTFSGDSYILSCMPFAVKNGGFSGIVPALYFRFSPIDIGGQTVMAPTLFAQFNAGDNNSNYRYDNYNVSFVEQEDNGRYRFTVDVNRLYYVTTRSDNVGSSVGSAHLNSVSFYTHSNSIDFSLITSVTTNVYATLDEILINFRKSTGDSLFSVSFDLTTAMDLVDYAATGQSLVISNIGYQNYETAYTDGYNVGYGVGYEKGVDDTIGGNMFGVLARGVDSFLDIHLIGDISIKHLLQIGFGVILLGFFIKVFLGG